MLLPKCYAFNIEIKLKQAKVDIFYFMLYTTFVYLI